MTSTKLCGLVFVMTLVHVHSVPLDSTTTRSLQFNDSIERVRNQVLEVRRSSDDMVLDTRTPPKFKHLAKKKEKKESTDEHFHVGIAIPVDEDSLKIEETTKKLNFYKIQRPTTNSGLSTWILLSGESSSTTPKAPNTSDVDDLKIIPLTSSRIVKPMFKKRTTTKHPTTQSSTQNIKPSTEVSTKRPKPSPNLVKIKASTLNNSQKKKIIMSSLKDITDNSINKSKVSSFTKPNNINATSSLSKKEYSAIPIEKNLANKSVDISAVNISNNASLTKHVQNLQLEAKDGDTTITEAPTKSENKKKNKTKKNRNKNRRKKPQDKTSKTNSTRINKNRNQLKEKPLGTQLYNYLSREMMPTLGVGLVGLMVTAGLASYFLYPFGAARRVYEVDRKDKGGSYHYNDIYSGGIAEEEVLGKVIAGMPLDKLQNSLYKSPTTRKAVSTSSHLQEGNKFYQHYRNSQTPHYHQSNLQNYQNHQTQHHHHNSQRGVVHGTVESVPIGHTKDNYLMNHYEKDSYQPITYRNENLESNKDTEINIDKKFVVGNVPKGIVEDITPAAVPEHGPRMIKSRKRRDINDSDNDIDSDNKIEHITDPIFANEASTTTMIDVSTTESIVATTPKNTTGDLENKVHSVVALIKDIFHLKINLGLELVKNATRSISTYIEKVQRRLDSHYRNSQKYF